MKRLKELLKRLEIAEAIANEKERAYEAEPMNEKAEKEFNEAYKKEFDLYVATAKELVKVTNNNIDFMTAKALVKGNRKELKVLLAKTA